MNKKTRKIFSYAALLCTSALFQNAAIAQERDIYMGAPVTLVKAANGAIANKKLLDRVEETVCLEPEILQPAEGIWTFCGFGLAPTSHAGSGSSVTSRSYRF